MLSVLNALVLDDSYMVPEQSLETNFCWPQRIVTPDCAFCENKATHGWGWIIHHQQWGNYPGTIASDHTHRTNHWHWTIHTYLGPELSPRLNCWWCDTSNTPPVLPDSYTALEQSPEEQLEVTALPPVHWLQCHKDHLIHYDEPGNIFNIHSTCNKYDRPVSTFLGK